MIRNREDLNYECMLTFSISITIEDKHFSNINCSSTGVIKAKFTTTDCLNYFLTINAINTYG